ncbi:MAG: GspMb/PilO family protein [Phycisphaerae bacterium]|nr:GspMb/PilO family protein [Phycisphaerae bacterium]
MKSIYKKYFIKVILTWAGSAALLFLVYMFVLAPQEESKKQLEAQLTEKKQIYSSALKATEKETKIQLTEQIQQLRDKLKDFVIDFEDSANLTFDISQIAGGKQVSAFNIDTKKDDGRTAVVSDKCVSENRIDVSFLAADFNQFAALLNALERHQPVIFVDGFSITRADKNSSSHQVNMSLSVFVRKTQDS